MLVKSIRGVGAIKLTINPSQSIFRNGPFVTLFQFFLILFIVKVNFKKA
jgi:hypothetical protein